MSSRSSPMSRSNSREERVDALGLGRFVAGTPGVGGVEAEAERRRGDPRVAAASAILASSSIVTPRCRAAAGRVLERTEPSSRPGRPLASEGRDDAVGDALDAGRDGRVAMRPGVDVHEPGAVAAGRGEVGGEDRDRAARNDGFGPARFTRYEAWTATGRMSSSSSRARNSGELLGRRDRRFQAVGLSTKTWMPSRRSRAARSAALSNPSPSGRWTPRRGPSGSIGAIVATAPDRRAVDDIPPIRDDAGVLPETEACLTTREGHPAFSSGRLVPIPASEQARVILPSAPRHRFPDAAPSTSAT